MYRFREQFALADEVCGRWASSQGTGLPNEILDAPASPNPLPDDIAIEVDKIIVQAPRHLKRVLVTFYRKRHTHPHVEDVAAYLGLRPRTVYEVLHQAHVYVLVKMNERGTLDRYAKRCERERALRVRRALGRKV
jgi:hypothetical protein